MEEEKKEQMIRKGKVEGGWRSERRAEQIQKGLRARDESRCTGSSV